LDFDAITIPHATPNDPYYASESRWNFDMVNIEAAWDYSTGDEDIIVAVIDWGIDYMHEDLSGNIWNNLIEI